MDDRTESDPGAAGSPAADADAIARSLVIRGRVQGVFFRASTEEVATRHGVTGWAANRDDGAVELWLEGPAKAVDEVEAWVRDGGPDAAIVDAVEVTDRQVSGEAGFRVR